MASLVGQQLKDTYDSLLKTSDNDALGGTYKEITDGAGNGSGLYLGTGENVGIGVSPVANLHIKDGSGSSDVRIQDSTETTTLYLQAQNGLAVVGTISNHDLRFDVNDNEKMRIDSSGNVLVGKTSADNTTQGIRLLGSAGFASFVRAEAEPMVINRLTDDGDLVDFRKDGSTVGSIGTRGGEITFHQGDTGIRLRGGTDNIIPVSADGTGRSNAIDIGSSSEKFKDLYLGGSVYLGGTTSANALDDYEEGTWSPVYVPQTGSFTTMTMDVVSATYTKIGRQVTVRAYIRTDSVDATGASGVLKIDGLPFTVATLQDSAGSIGDTLNWTNPPDGCFVEASTSKIVLKKTNITSTSVVGDLATGAVADQNILRLTATYFV